MKYSNSSQSNSKSEDTIYVCLVKDCERFVAGEEGVLWTCADHGENMVLQKYKVEPPQDSPLGQVTSLDDSTLNYIFTTHLQEIKAGHDSKLAEEVIAWHKAKIAKLFEQIRSEVIKDYEDKHQDQTARVVNKLRAEQLEALTRLEQK